MACGDKHAALVSFGLGKGKRTDMDVYLSINCAWEISAVAQILGQQGHLVYVTSAQDWALSSLPVREHATTVMVMDLRSQPQCGLQAIRAMRTHHGFAPAVLALTRKDSSSRIEAIEAGADCCLDDVQCHDSLCAVIHSLGRRAGLGIPPPLAGLTTIVKTTTTAPS